MRTLFVLTIAMVVSLYPTFGQHIDGGVYSSEARSYLNCFGTVANLATPEISPKQREEVAHHADHWARILKKSPGFTDDDWVDQTGAVAGQILSHAKRTRARVLPLGKESTARLLSELDGRVAELAEDLKLRQWETRAWASGLLGAGLFMGSGCLYLCDMWNMTTAKTLTSLGITMIFPALAIPFWIESKKELNQSRREHDSLNAFLDLVDGWQLDIAGNARINVMAVYSFQVKIDHRTTVVIDIAMGAERGSPIQGAVFSSLK